MDQPDHITPLLQEDLEDLYQHAPCGYLSTFPDGTFANVNRTFLDWTGYAADTLLAGVRLQDLLTVSGRMFYETHYVPLLHLQGGVRELAFDLRCCDGRILPVFLNAVQIRDAATKPVVHRITLFDARERRAYERELQHAQQQAEQALQIRDQFLAVAAHALHTPVTTIYSHITRLQQHVHQAQSLSIPDQQALHIVVEQTTRLSQMVQSLLDVSRIETGHLALDCGPVDLTLLLYHLIAELHTIYGTQAIDVRYQAQTALIQGDTLRLEQVFRNLITNALQYSAPDSHVTVVLRHHATQVVVEVQDRGIGMPADALPHLFERFYRVANRPNEASVGMGIGLYVVKEIVDLHRGDITVTSIEGQGSTFTVSFAEMST